LLFALVGSIGLLVHFVTLYVVLDGFKVRCGGAGLRGAAGMTSNFA